MGNNFLLLSVTAEKEELTYQKFNKTALAECYSLPQQIYEKVLW